MDVLTYGGFCRTSGNKKVVQSLLWLFKGPLKVAFKGYDVIYCDDSMPFYPALVRLISPKSKIVIRLGDFHLMYYFTGWAYSFLHFFEKLGWRSADKILSISEAMRDRLLEEGFRSDVIPDPVESADFLPQDPDTKDKIVMFHGVISKNKGLDLVLKAAARLPEYHFWIVGDGPDSNRLKSMAPDNVVFTGWHPYEYMDKLIAQCSVGLALRSDNPGNQYVVTSPYLQYSAAGKPCLVTRRKVFGDYKWQFDTVDEMVEKIKELMNKPDEGKKQRRLILEKHDAKKVSEQIWSALQF